MRKIIVLLIAFALVVTMLPANSYAGPWTVNKGKVWMEVFTRYFHSNHYFDSDGRKDRWDSGGCSGIYDIEAKMEYGATDNFSILVGIPYTWSEWKNEYGTLKNEGFKMSYIGGRYMFMKVPVVTALQFKAYFSPRDNGKNPQLCEYGQAYAFRVLAGQSWYDGNGNQFYVSGETGFLARTNSKYANIFPVFVEGGYAPFDWLMLKGEIDCSISCRGTGQVKDTYTWRAGPIINMVGEGFSSIEKGENEPEDDFNLNLELQYGQTFAGRGDPEIPEADKVSAAQEFILKIQSLF